MDNQNNSRNTANALHLDEINKTTIRNIKKAIKEVGTQKVLRRLGWTQQNLSGHLNEKTAAHAKIEVLEKIVEAVELERQIIEERALQVQRRSERLTAA